ncbi:hypothetical protein HA414_23115 [Klebsiella pneumoniae]|nr:hypothetical protein [Klebsiella pneumoniae]
MTKSTITRDQLRALAVKKVESLKFAITQSAFTNIRRGLEEELQLAEFALAAMDSESGCLPLDYLQGHKDGLEWAAQLAEANHPETGDWLYDDPIELAKAIRKGPDMPPSQPAPVAHVCTCPSGDGSLRWPCQVHPGSSPVIPDGSAAMLRRWLAFGRGMQNAGRQLPHNLIAETESMLAATPQEVKGE